MIKKVLIILNLLILSQFHSQIKMEFNLDQINKKTEVTLVNVSDGNLAIPIGE